MIHYTIDPAGRVHAVDARALPTDVMVATCASPSSPAVRTQVAELVRRANHHDDLVMVCRMALDQLEFADGERRRGWDGAFLRAELRRVLTATCGELMYPDSRRVAP